MFLEGASHLLKYYGWMALPSELYPSESYPSGSYPSELYSAGGGGGGDGGGGSGGGDGSDGISDGRSSHEQSDTCVKPVSWGQAHIVRQVK